MVKVFLNIRRNSQATEANAFPRSRYVAVRRIYGRTRTVLCQSLMELRLTHFTGSGSSNCDKLKTKCDHEPPEALWVISRASCCTYKLEVLSVVYFGLLIS